MQKGLTTEHRRKLLRNTWILKRIHIYSNYFWQRYKLFTKHTFEQLLYGGSISNKCRWHFQSFWWDVTNCCFNIVWNPFNEVATIFVLNTEHLLIDFFHWHVAAEYSSYCQVSSMSRITSGHHIFCVKHLLCQFYEKGTNFFHWFSITLWFEFLDTCIETYLVRLGRDNFEHCVKQVEQNQA